MDIDFDIDVKGKVYTFFRQAVETMSQMTFLSKERDEFFNDIPHVRQAKLPGFHES